jgi:hypothetical protein
MNDTYLTLGTQICVIPIRRTAAKAGIFKSMLPGPIRQGLLRNVGPLQPYWISTVPGGHSCLRRNDGVK